MSNTGAFVNPQAKDEAVLFYVWENETLALEHRTLGSDNGARFKANSHPKWQGPISHPGHIAAVAHKKSFAVYGFTRSWDKDGKDTTFIAQISPIVNPLGSYDSPDALAGSGTVLTAVTDGEATDYVYFFRAKEGGARTIVEFSLPIKAAKSKAKESDLLGSPSEPFQNAQPHADSCIAAVYDKTPEFGTRRTVFFQRAGDRGPDVWYQHNNEEAPTRVPSSNNANPGTPLAALVLPPDENKKRRIALYYVDNGKQLRRVTRIDDHWTPSAVVTTNVTGDSDLTAVWNEGDKAVQIFVQTTDDKSIHQVADDLSANV